MFSYRVFREGDDIMLAISDSSILGKSFEEKGMQLDVPENFYSGSTCDKDGALKLINSATIINAVGNNIISLMMEKDIIEEHNVLKIGGIAHAQVVSVRQP